MVRKNQWYCSAAQAVCILAALSLGVSTGHAQAQWRNGGNSAVHVQLPQQVRQRIADLSQRDDARRFLIQLDGPVTADGRRNLSAAGIELLSYAGDHTWFAATTRLGVDPETVPAGVVSAAAIERAWKLDPRITTKDYPDYARAVDPADGTVEVAAYVIFHADVDLVKQGAAVATQYGARIVGWMDSINGLVIELPEAQLLPLADHDDVQWIEPPLPMMTETNSSNRVITQADVAQAAPYGLSGAGVNVLVYDGGYGLQSHNDFGGRLTVRDSSGISDHSTHVAGTIGGNGAQSAGANRGMAPAVIMQSYGFDYDGTGTFLYTNPGDIQVDYDEAINVFGAQISNNSIGTNTESNGFNCAFQGDYGVTSQLIDSIVRGSLGAPMRIVWANGNERQGSRCDVEGFGDYYSTAPPACAKNHITVGALNSNDDSMTSFSSWGPADDGRMKPDIAAPGCQSGGDGGVTSCSSSGGYTVKCGTSMAAPTVTGLLALLLEDYGAQFPGLALPRNSTLKILLAQNAVDLGNVGPDYQYGYGSVRVVDTIDHMRTGWFIEDEVDQAATTNYKVIVDAGTPELKITMAWDDAPGTPNVNPALVNDLDLVVTSPTGTQFFPWTLNPISPSSLAVRTQGNHVDNIEQVLVDSPESGTWSVDIVGFNVPEGPQPFSLCASSLLTQQGVFIDLPTGAPETIDPNVPVTIPVNIIAVEETLIGGTETFHYRNSGGSFSTAPLTPLGGDAYEATLPAAVCGTLWDYYVSADGTISGTVTLPPGAPANVYRALAGYTAEVFADNFQTDKGWTTEVLGATSGGWERGVPVNDPAWAYDPNSDSDGSGQCYLTQNTLGNTDVDNGAVRLTSPLFDISNGIAAISYDYYLYLNIPGTDTLVVEMNDGLGWREVAVHDTDGGHSWRSNAITQEDIDAAGLFNNNIMRIRFTADDADPPSIVEAGIDAVSVVLFGCAETGIIDCNGNGIDDPNDIAGGFSQDCDGNGVPDECEADGDGDGVPDFCDACPADNPDDSDGDGVCDSTDICPGGDDTADADGDGVPDFCDACPADNPDDSDGDGVCDSTDICPGGDDNVDADGDGVPDFCDACPADNPDDSDGDGVCDSADICPGGDDNVDSDGDGVPDFCDCPGDVDGDNDVDITDLGVLLSNFGQSGPGIGGDLNGDDNVDVTDLGILLANFGVSCP